MAPPIDLSSLNGLVQLLHHTTVSGKPSSHTFLFRSQANPLGWTVQLYEWGKDEGGTTRWKGWEGGWNGEKELKKMVTLVPDLTGAAFVRRISNHICSGHLHVEGFKTGFEDSLKLTITDPPKTFEPFIIPMSSISSELVAQQGFDFLRDSIAFNTTHRIAAIPRDATESPEIAMNDLPDTGAVIEDLKAALEREKKAHKTTKAQLETLEAQEPESQKASIPVFHSRVGFSTANANVKANRPEKPVFDDDTSSDTSNTSHSPPPSPKKKGSVVPQGEPSGSETEPEEDEDDAMDEDFSQKTLQASSQAQPSSTFPQSPSKPPKSPSKSKHHPTSSQMLPPPTPTKAKPNSQQPKSSPIASGSKLSPPKSKISPRKNLLPAKDRNDDSSDDSSMEESPSLTASASKKNKGVVKKTGSTFIKPPPPPKRLIGRARAMKRGTFGADSSSSSSSDEEGPAKKKAKASSASSPPPVKSSASKGKGKVKMVVDEDEKSGSETE